MQCSLINNRATEEHLPCGGMGSAILSNQLDRFGERELFTRIDRSPLTLLTSSHSYPQGVSAQKVMMVLFYHHSLFDHYLKEDFV